MSIYEKLRSGEYEANPPLDAFEILVLNALLASADEAHQARSNKDVGAEVGASRAGVSNARRRIASKIDIIKTGFLIALGISFTLATI